MRDLMAGALQDVAQTSQAQSRQLASQVSHLQDQLEQAASKHNQHTEDLYVKVGPLQQDAMCC